MDLMMDGLPTPSSCHLAKLLKIYSRLVWETEYSLISNSALMSSISPNKYPMVCRSLLTFNLNELL